MSDDLISRSALLEKAEWEESYMGTDGFRYVRLMDVLNAPAVEAEPVVHAKWEDEWGGKYANPRYRCSACKTRALYRMEQDMLLTWHDVQSLTYRCHHCGAHMDEEVAHE